MAASRSKFTILMADDDADDRKMTERALKQAQLVDDFVTVDDGEELIDYLKRRGRYAAGQAPKPSLILLDLNMPRKNGREALAEIKQDDDLKAVPVLIFSTSRADEDVLQAYQMGANSYLNKPESYETLLAMMQAVRRYWHETVEVPS